MLSRLRVAAASALVAIVLAPSAARSAEPSRDLEEYVLFALEELTFKGANNCAVCGRIVGGHVGVNRVDPLTFSPNLSIGGTDNPVFLGDGTQLVSDTARIGAQVDIFDLFVNRTQTGFDPAQVRNVQSGFAAPILASLPPFPPFTAGGPDVTVPKNDSTALPPGSWGDVVVRDGATLTLDGTYALASLRVGRNARVVTTAGTVVHVADALTANNDSVVGPANDARFFVRGDGVEQNDNTVNFGRRVEFHGIVYAPFGRIGLGNMTNLFGRFWGRTIGSDFNVNVSGPPDDEPEPPTPTPKDASLLHSAKNRNEGANPIIAVGTQLRAVVAFDGLGGLNPGSVKQATLVLHIASSSGWPAAGGNVSVHRLLQDFTEGNGKRFALPPAQWLTGSGAGVTWNCATDTDISDEGKDCAGNWLGSGAFLAAATDAQTHVNGQTGAVLFDVTADVVAGARGWLLQKKSGSGEVHYYSKEGAAALGDPSLAPMLLIELF